MSNPAAEGMRVLVLDDEPSVRILLQEVLAKNGFAVQMTARVQEARELCREQTFDLLVVDKNLPDGNGLDFIEWATGHYAGDCESVIITSYASLESSAHALKLGVADYILKPFGQALEIQGRIRRVAEKLNDRRMRRQAETALKESEERLKILFEHAPDGYFLYDGQGKFLDGNRAAEKIVGRSKEELIGKSFLELDLLDPESLEWAAHNLRRIVEGGVGEIGTYSLKRPDGSLVPVEVRSFPLEIQGQDVILAIARDVTERKRAEASQARLHAAIEQAAAEWRQTVDAIASPILLLSLEGRIIRMNAAAKNILGSGYQDHLGKNIREVTSGQPWNQIVNMVEYLAESGVTEPTQVRDESGQKTWDITATLSPRNNADDVIIVVAHDVSEVVDLHELLRRNAVMSAMGSLLGGVAHEVRNPLFGITATLDAFEARHGDRQQFERYFKTLRSELARISDLMKDLLEFGKPISLGLTRGSIGSIITHAVEACEAAARESQVEVSIEIEPDLPPIRMDENRLLQAVQNVLENAIQHAGPGGTINIQARKNLQEDKPQVSCAILDSGPGFAEDDLPLVFEPFFSRRRGGTGLGLSIVQRIVEEHMGAILVNNRPEGGGMVTLHFPAVQQAKAEDSHGR